MSVHIEEKINKLEEKKKELEIKKKTLEEKERRKNYKRKEKRYIEIGKLAEKANIFNFEKDVLLGAFLEISEKSNSDEQINRWKERVESQNKVERDKTPISISFNEDPTKKEKSIMKEISFQYNKFRKEFYGYGYFEEIQNLVKDFQCKVEKLEN